MNALQELAVQIEMVCTCPMAKHGMVVLRTRHGNGYLPVRIPVAEAQAVERILAGRDVAQDLALQLLAPLGGRIERVVIRSLDEQNDSATVTLVQDEQRRDVTARMGDALVLAIRAGAPLFVTSEVVERAGLRYDLALATEQPGLSELERGVTGSVLFMPEMQPQVGELFAHPQSDLIPSELLTMVLMHRSGRLVTLQGQESFEDEDTLRLRIGALYRQVFDQRLDGLLEALIEREISVGSIEVASERSTGVSCWGDTYQSALLEKWETF